MKNNSQNPLTSQYINAILLAEVGDGAGRAAPMGQEQNDEDDRHTD